nr:AAA family ATPase [uncultured Caproiciproducens sp.]
MAKEYNSDLQQKLEEYITKAGSQSKAAELIGYSTGTISTYRKGIYNGDVEKFETRLKEIFSVNEEAETLYSSPDFVPTSISKHVYETIRICHLKGGLAIECGDAGIGKTKAAKKYVDDYPNSAIYVTVNPCLVSVTAFLKLLCRQLKLPTGRKDDMWLDIDSRLRGSRKVLIIDEAQHLPIKTIESIRAFADSNPELGVILVGNAETVTTKVGKSREAFAQIRNRTKLTEIRHTSHITKDDIKLLFPALANSEKEIEFLHTVARSEQGVRGAVNLYSNAADNENTTYQGLLAMAKAMHIITY